MRIQHPALKAFFFCAGPLSATKLIKAVKLPSVKVIRSSFCVFCLLLVKRHPSEFLVKQRVKTNEQLAKSRVTRKNSEQRAKSNERQTKNNVQRPKTNEQ